MPILHSPKEFLQNKNLTDFEKKVYAAVSKIPAGEVRSYKWVAAKIGKPRAYRAVGNALNKNPYIGKVPCHRVIKSDGAIGGFAKGTRLKKKLLKAEHELIVRGKHPPLFKDRRLESVLRNIEEMNYDGIDKSWVDILMLAQKTHYRAAGRKAKG